MATRTIIMKGLNLIEGSAATVIFNGVQVFSGPITKAVTLNEGTSLGDMITWTFEQTDAEASSQTLVNYSMSIACTNGSIGTAGLRIDGGPNWATSNAKGLDDTGYYIPTNHEPYGDGSDTALAERSAILLNGVALEYPAIEPFPTGTEAAPTWAGWNFVISSGDTLTCTVRVPRQGYVPA